MEKFEYYTYVYDTKGFMGGKIEGTDFQNELNRLGQVGWELVSSFTTNQGQGYTRSVVSIFKRKIDY
ncbi:MAG: DUF4177 domain-containing protein [Cellulosilyticaceae bacterium]